MYCSTCRGGLWDLDLLARQRRVRRLSGQGFDELGSKVTTIYCGAELRKLWPKPLAWQWSRHYPELFDADDVRIARTQPRNHFAEWFVAIHLFQRDGAFSLIEKYLFNAHPAKVARLAELLSEAERDKLAAICKCCGVQPPDLFVFIPGTKRYWFAEVKGPGDRLSEKQVKSHRAISQELGVPVEFFRVRILIRALAGIP